MEGKRGEGKATNTAVGLGWRWSWSWCFLLVFHSVYKPFVQSTRRPRVQSIIATSSTPHRILISPCFAPRGGRRRYKVSPAEESLPVHPPSPRLGSIYPGPSPSLLARITHPVSPTVRRKLPRISNAPRCDAARARSARIVDRCNGGGGLSFVEFYSRVTTCLVQSCLSMTTSRGNMTPTVRPSLLVLPIITTRRPGQLFMHRADNYTGNIHPPVPLPQPIPPSPRA